MIPYNKPFLTGNEFKYIEIAIKKGKISGNGYFTHLCQEFFLKRYEFPKCLLTTSCTDALEMSAILADVKVGDEVIVPSFTFTSSANAFILRGAKIVFADSGELHPNITAKEIGRLITKQTKAILIVHYAGVACEMDEIVKICKENEIILIEDCAHSIDSYYNGKPLGSFGTFSAFSFHETKNINAGEGGMLVINDERFFQRAEIIWEKGTNRVSFLRGDVNKYEWIDVGSSFLPSELTSAFLFAQLEKIEVIQNKRIQIYYQYYDNLEHLHNVGSICLPYIFDYASNNAHIFYFICKNKMERDDFINFMNSKGIKTIFHYLPLHKSPFYSKFVSLTLPNAEFFSDCLVRLPLFYELTNEQIDFISKTVFEFYKV